MPFILLPFIHQRVSWLCLIFGLAFFCLLPIELVAKDNQNEPTLVQADKLSYNQKTNIVTATGHVEVSHGKEVLRADKIIYYQNKNVVRAKGHVAVLQPDGDVLFADQAELTNDMKQAFVKKASILFNDNSRLAAANAQRYEGRYLVAERGVYSACNICVKDPKQPPLWQIKATRITHDNVAKNVIYRDAVVEMGGVPVLYTPYFSHPDPTVDRRQGLLSPSGGYNKDVGTFVRIPYYFDIAPNSDVVIAPVFSTEDRLMLSGSWRQRFTSGYMQWNGSFTRADLIDEFGTDQGSQWRGHLFGSSLFNLNNEWRAGTEVAFTSDKSYLQRYKIISDDQLTNRAYLEHFHGRNYAIGNMYYFQDLRPGVQLAQPFIAPDLRFSMLGEPGKTLGGRWSFDGGLLVTSRDQTTDITKQGANTRRISLNTGWGRQLISNTGFVTDLAGTVRLDGYWADNIPDPNVSLGTGFSKIAQVRQFAQADMTFRYPLGRSGHGYQQILEPIVMISAAPQVSNRDNLPNEDSLDVEFDETNLFASNRFTGTDRLEGGTRAAYGLRHTLIGDNGARLEAVGGQIYRLKPDPSFPDGSGLNSRFSDYVGRLELYTGPWFDANYGFRLDRHDFSLERQELAASGGAQIFRSNIKYLSVNQTEATTGLASSVEEGTLGFNSHFADYWDLSGSYTQAFQPTPGPRLISLGINYKDECFQLGVTAQHDYTQRLDLSAGTSVMFYFYLKNIGGIQNSTANKSPY